MAGFLDSVERELYDKVFGKDETQFDEFTMLNAWKFFIDCCADNPKISYCVIDIEKKGNRYIIKQIMLTAKTEPIMVKGDRLVGRKIQAYTLSDDVIDFMDGNNRAYLYLDTLLKQEKR